MMLSRIQSTQTLFELFETREHKPEVLFNASAMGYYLQIYLQVIRNYIEHFHLISYQKLYINGNGLRINLSNSVHVSF